MVVGCSYSSGANFTAGNGVEPGMFCGQAAARGATYRLVGGSEVTIYSVGTAGPDNLWERGMKELKIAKMSF